MDDIRVPGKKVAKRPAKLELKRPATHSVQPKKKPAPKAKAVVVKKPTTRLNKKRSLRYRIKFWWKLNNRRYGWRWRAANVGAALLILFSVVTPVALRMLDGLGYQLSNSTLDLVGKTDPKLTSKLSYDAKTKTYQFNKESIKEFNPVDQLKQQVGTPDQSKDDKALYSLDVHQDPKKGVTYYDTNSQLSFSLVPQFGGRSGKLQQQRLVYPLGNNTQAVYTLKNNGLKEDIIVQKATDDTMRFSYTLQLPKTLEAKAMDDGSGSIGIYSANPSLFGNISYGSDADREKVEKARENGTKDTLVFGIPAPTITTSKDDDASKVKSRFELKDNTLTVIAEHLTSLKQSFSIDPSVVITSAGDFETGNNEGNISFATSGSVTRDGLSGGTVGTWNFTDNGQNRGTTQNAGSGAANGMINGRERGTVVAYGGYLYAIGGVPGGGTYTSTVERAPINSNGTLGTWITDTAMPTARQTVAVAYNGYMYIVGGDDGNKLTEVRYARISSSNGSLGSWTATTSLGTARVWHSVVASSGMLYVINGCVAATCNLANPTAAVLCAPLNPDGSVGTWNNSCGATSLTGRIGGATTVYNGFVYHAGGCQTYNLGSCNNNPTTVMYAKINSDGTLATWLTAATNFSTGRSYVSLVASKGYLYLTNNIQNNASAVQYAPVHANGDVGAWADTTDNNVANKGAFGLAAHGNYLYIIGGCTSWPAGVCNTTSNAVEYAPIDSAGVLKGGTWPTGASVQSAATSYSRVAVAYNGFLYFTGGLKTSGPALKEAQYVSINSDGSLGTWTNTTNMNVGRFSQTLVAYGGYIYAIGGCPSGVLGVGCTGAAIASTEYAPINADGSIGAWTNGTTMANGRYSLQTSIYNGYMYAVGGIGGAASSEYAQINTSTHAIGAWTTTTAPASPSTSYTAAYNGHIYTRDRTNGKVYEAVLSSSDGSIGTWSDANAADLTLTASDTAGASNVFVNKGYIYAMHDDANSDVVEYAKINSNGTITGWTSTTASSSIGTQQPSSAIYNDALYIINLGGTTQYQLINHGGNGMPSAWASAGSAFTTGRYSHSTVAYNDFLYIAGGTCSGGSSCNNDLQYAPINANGSIGSWGTDSDANANGQTITAMIAYKGYMYITTASGANHSTQYALICTGSNNGVDGCGASAGPVGTWHLTTDFAAGTRTFQALATYNDRLYIFGGNSGGSDLSDVLYAPINSDGTIGSWTTQSGGLYAAFNRQNAQYAINNGYLYLINGHTAEVRFAPINSGGSIGSWTITNPLPLSGVGQSYSYVANGYLYHLQGGSDGTLRNKVIYAPLGVNGTVGEWVTSNNTFSTARTLPVGVFYNGNLYITGGCTAIFLTLCSTFAADVQYAGQQAIPRKGLYSKLLTFNFGISPRQFTYNGTLSNGTSDISYKGSSSATSWTGSTANAGSLTNARCPSPASNRYMQLFIALDDSLRAVFPDESTNAANLTDLTLSYEFARAPNMRLKLGKILQENLGQTDLDICKLAS